jgi:hypothetical protein
MEQYGLFDHLFWNESNFLLKEAVLLHRLNHVLHIFLVAVGELICTGKLGSESPAPSLRLIE